MNILTQAFRMHIRLIRSNILASILVLIVFSAVAITSYEHHVSIYAIGYLGAVWLCAFVTDVVTMFRKTNTIGFPIKRPVKTELMLILICTALGISFLVVRYFSNWAAMPGMLKLAFVPLLLFTFPIVLAIVYLFVYKYKPRELGINLNYWYLPLFILFIFGAVTLTVAPANSHWQEMYRQEGLAGMLFMGFIEAALPEEFARMLLQTRLGAAFKSSALGWIITSAIWAASHIPTFSQDYKTEGLLPGIIGAIRIIPLGLLWGYITHRTKSIIPSVVVHAFNLWGLQWM